MMWGISAYLALEDRQAATQNRKLYSTDDDGREGVKIRISHSWSWRPLQSLTLLSASKEEAVPQFGDGLS
jgi:hypothetical protein